MMASDALLSDYLEKYSSPEDEVLAELNRETQLKVLNPRMLSGHLQGNLLTFISKMIQPARILEIGTYTGYSAICMARGLKPGGKLITIEFNDEITSIPLKYFAKAGLHDQIELKVGNALEIIPQLSESFDLVFIDAEKTEYSKYLRLVTEKVRSGGYILADNVLWSGKVLHKINDRDSETLAIQKFNEEVVQDGRFENVILPMRDGINLIRKK